MNECGKKMLRYFGRKNKAPDPETPFICPFPFFMEREEQLQEEEKARRIATSTDEDPQPIDKQ
jgi:hypothetical protein